MQRFLGNLKKSFRGNKGFTLIELIVVIAVIGVLVLLAAPKFLGYTRDAKVAALQSDVKTLSNAALLYNIESTNDEWPYAGDADVGFTNLPVGLQNAMLAMGFDDTALSNKVVRFDTAAIETTGELYKYVKNLNNPVDDYVLVVEGLLEGEVFHSPDGGTAGQVDGDRLTTWYGVEARVKVTDAGGNPDDSAVAADTKIESINGVDLATVIADIAPTVLK